MIDPEKQQVTLKIANLQIKTTIYRKEEESLRYVEREVNNLFNNWTIRNPMKSKEEILAMVAFQYAKLFYDVSAMNGKREAELLDFVKKYEETLNTILLVVSICETGGSYRIISR